MKLLIILLSLSFFSQFASASELILCKTVTKSQTYNVLIKPDENGNSSIDVFSYKNNSAQGFALTKVASFANITKNQAPSAMGTDVYYSAESGSNKIEGTLHYTPVWNNVTQSKELVLSSAEGSAKINGVEIADSSNCTEL